MFAVTNDPSDLPQGTKDIIQLLLAISRISLASQWKQKNPFIRFAKE